MMYCRVPAVFPGVGRPVKDPSIIPAKPSQLFQVREAATADCPICQLRLGSTECFDSHTQHIATEGELSYECQICGYKAVSKHTMTNHVRTHTGEKPFACHHCSFRTSSSPAIPTHIRRKYGGLHHLSPFTEIDPNGFDFIINILLILLLRYYYYYVIIVNILLLLSKVYNIRRSH